MHKKKKPNQKSLPCPGEVANMTQCSFTKPNTGFAVNPCNIQGLLQLNQTQFELSLKLCFPIREQLTRCQGSETYLQSAEG